MCRATITGTEIVDGHADAVLAQLAHGVLRELEPDEPPFGHFHDEIALRGVGDPRKLLQPSDDLLGVQIVRGQIDRNVEIRAPQEQILGILPHQFQHVPGDALDHAGVLGDRDEQVRAYHLAARTLPAYQCLRAHPRMGVQIHDRLVVHAEFAAPDRRPDDHGHRRLQPSQVHRGEGKHQSGNEARRYQHACGGPRLRCHVGDRQCGDRSDDVAARTHHRDHMAAGNERAADGVADPLRIDVTARGQ